MSPAWFYLAGNQRIGPLSFEQLHAAGSAGLVRHDTLVCEGATGDWQPACRVPGLLTSPPQSPPGMAARVAPPPPPVRSASIPPGAGASAGPGALLPPVQPGALPEARKSAFRLRGLVAGLCVLAGVCLWIAWAAWPAGKARELPTTEDASAGTVKTESLSENPSPACGRGAEGQASSSSRIGSKPPAATATANPFAEAQAAARNPPVIETTGVSSAEAELARMVRGDTATAKVEPAATGRRKNRKMIASGTTPTAQTSTPAGAERRAQNPFESAVDVTPAGKIDELVFGKLKQLGIPPAGLCSDGVFIRRVYLDVIGTLPTAEEAKSFLQDSNPRKRSLLIDRLLEREEFADYWALKWGDLLRVKAEFPINLWPYASQAYHRWIRTCLKENMPYDRFVRELLTAGGSNFRVPQVNFYRAVQSRRPPAIAQAVALTFLGMRADKWPNERLAGMAVFFSQMRYKTTAEWKEEIVLFDPHSGSQARPSAPLLTAAFPDGTPAKIAADQDPREVFADWLLDAKNPWFAPCIVNRIWCWLRGRGIVHEPDDVRPDNPPQNPQLLDWLAAELIAAHYDLRHIYRLILNSQAYQLSALPRAEVGQSEAQFAHYAIRRLEGETLIDALCQITGTTEKYSSLIPEPFTFIPEDVRTIALPDGSITSSFLEMFGRPPRDTGMEAERNNRVTSGQRLHLLNSTHIRQKIEDCAKFQALARSDREIRDVAAELYLTILSRLPSDEESGCVQAYCRSRRKAGVMDVAWALINSEEFLHRH